MADLQEFTISLNSSVLAGAINKTTDNSYFEIQFTRPITIPHTAKNVKMFVSNATVWNTSFNISSTLYNNKITITTGGITYNLTVPDGLYDVNGLNAAIDRQLVNAGGLTGSLILLGDESTQRVVIQFTAANQQVDFTVANNCRGILGFDSRLVPLAPTAGASYETADAVASFNTIDYFLLHSDLVGDGIQINGAFNKTIAKVPITSAPGSQVVFTPVNPTILPSNHLRGRTIQKIACWITNQDNTVVYLPDNFSLDISFSYYE